MLIPTGFATMLSSRRRHPFPIRSTTDVCADSSYTLFDNKMGFFFRRSTSLGPFRFNFSRSGIGASVGVKGARLTLTPRGTTYVTVGSHGFYYRETLSHLDDIRQVNPTVLRSRHSGSHEDTIATAGSLDLVDSSSERLIQQLNERANMFNPAWILFVASVMSLVGLAMLPAVPSLPNLPDVTLPFSAERSANTIDEYAALTARYGEPNSILYTEADPLAPVPVGTAHYIAAHVKVVFVPNGCVNAYSRDHEDSCRWITECCVSQARDEKVSQCHPSANSGWTTVGYIDSAENIGISSEAAMLRLGAIAAKIRCRRS